RAQKGAMLGLSSELAIAFAERRTAPDLEIRQGWSIAGNVRTTDGHPIPEASLRLIGSWAGLARARHGHTSLDGTYRFDGLPPGTYGLTAKAPGYAPVDKEDILVSEQNLEHIDVTLPAACGITGRVRSSSGQVIRGAVVRAFYGQHRKPTGQAAF